MTKEELEMRKLVRESDSIDRTDGSELAKAFNHLWEKYIEQEPCEDCISREAVLEILGNYGCTNREGLLFRDIKELPSVKSKQPEWISVKRLPKKDGRYLVTVQISSDLKLVEVLSFAKDLYEANNFYFWNMMGVSGWYEHDSEYGDCIVDGVLAWKELPETYKAESEDKE